MSWCPQANSAVPVLSFPVLIPHACWQSPVLIFPQCSYTQGGSARTTGFSSEVFLSMRSMISHDLTRMAGLMQA